MQNTEINTPDALWRPMTQHQVMRGKDAPSRIVRAEGCFLYDDQGKKHLDGLAGLWCVNVGYGRQELADVARDQGADLRLDLKRRLTLSVIRGWSRLRIERARSLIGSYRAKRLSPDVPEYDPMRDGYYAPFELYDEVAARSPSWASW